MDFGEKLPIYLQIANHVCENILLKKWPACERIISIRELAVSMEVNPNTVQRSYDFLQQKQIISNRRGIGYFVEEDAEEKILAFRREEFLANDLPLLYKNMYLLGIGTKEIVAGYEKFINSNSKLFKHENK